MRINRSPSLTSRAFHFRKNQSPHQEDGWLFGVVSNIRWEEVCKVGGEPYIDLK